MPADPRAAQGTVAVVAAASLWGTIGVLSVSLFRLGLSAWDVAFWRTAFSAAGMLLFAALFRRELFRPTAPRDALWLVGFGVVAVALFFTSFQFANQLTSVAVAVVLLYTAPIFVMVGGHFLLGERLTPARLVLACVVVAGVWATSLGAAEAEVRVTPAGIAWGLLSAASYSTYYFFGRRHVPRIGVQRTLLFSLVVGTLVLALAGWVAGAPPRLSLPAGAWAPLVGISVGGTLLANALYYFGLARLEASRAAVIASVEPVLASLLALIVLGQRLTWIGWVGVATVVATAAIASRLRR